jgi:hypothetical protein
VGDEMSAKVPGAGSQAAASQKQLLKSYSLVRQQRLKLALGHNRVFFTAFEWCSKYLWFAKIHAAFITN